MAARYLFNCWWRNVKRGKLGGRSLHLLLTILALELKCLFLTGRTLNEINKTS